MMKRFSLVVLLVAGAMMPVHAADARVATLSHAVEVKAKTPAVIFLIRHAEKPEGDKQNINLTPTGFHRAQLLPELFTKRGDIPALPRPDAIFATEISKHSNRPVETVTPLAKQLGLPINHDFADAEFSSLAKELTGGKYAGKVVLVCWHHGEIPHLAGALGVTDAPEKWDDNTFDLIWRVEWVDGVAKMTVLHQMLLDGDSK